MKKLIFIFFIATSCLAIAQNTQSFKIASINLLNYPNSFITSDTRYNNFGSIMHHIAADIIISVELNDEGDDRAADSLLVRGLNTNGISYYNHADMLSPNGGLNNMLFYNTQKFVLYKHIEIAAPIRNLDYYTLYFIDPNLPCTHDTTFIDIAIMHLKASNTGADATTRNNMAIALENYINTLPANRNVIVGGDFNFYACNNSEPAYMTLTNTANVQPFTDVLGNTWVRNSSSYVTYYTQSTRGNAAPYLGGNGGASGGLDDRFDYIMPDNTVLNGLNRVLYVNNSLKSVGNDGQHFDKSIIEPPANTDVPANIAQDIFDLSDHYPMSASFTVTLPTPNIATPTLLPASITNVCVLQTASLQATASLNTNEQIEWYNSNNFAIAPVQVGNTYVPSTTSAGTATYYAIVRNTITQCYSTNPLSVTLNVVANPTPIISASSATVCANEVVTYSISNPNAANTYNWTIVGGIIISGQGTPNITVEWTGNTAGSVGVVESTP